MRKEIAHFIINGRSYDVIISSNATLSELLRDQLHLTGTKIACGVGECGACTVLVDGRPTFSCCTLAVSVRNRNILTIEGLSNGQKLHVIQQAFIDTGAVQCGFCTPGMILMAKALLDEKPNRTKEEIKEGLGGNLCRCTGYVKIIEAVTAASQQIVKGNG